VRRRKKSCNWIAILLLILLFSISVGYCTISTTLSSTGQVTFGKNTYRVNYAVQIYGIDEDVDESGMRAGLTFGPALGNDFNNKYITHEYEETSSGSGIYYVKIITHTVISDEEELIEWNYLYKNGGNSEKVTRTTEEKNKYDVNLHDMTWSEIKSVLDKTIFTDCLLCGDTKKVEIILNDKIASGITYTQLGDGAGMLDETINAHYKMWNRALNNPDYPEYNNSAVGTGVLLETAEELYGSNARSTSGYSSSHIRSTLIGKNNKTNVGYAGDDNLSENESLYSCLPDDLKTAIKKKKIRYVTGDNKNSYNLNNDISDNIWLFSEREMHGLGEHTGGSTEGLALNSKAYSKFENPESDYYIPTYNNDETLLRMCYNESGTSLFAWLRTPYLTSTYHSYYINADGTLNYAFPYSHFGLAFGFCIGEYGLF